MKPRILLVEDDRSISEPLAEHLERGLEVRPAAGAGIEVEVRFPRGRAPRPPREKAKGGDEPDEHPKEA